MNQNFWIFGYGSLMWRPDFPYQKRVRALLPGYQRSFSLLADRHRGTPEVPGLVLGLIQGGNCEGFAFLVPSEQEEKILQELDERETIAYNRVLSPIQLKEENREVQAWNYVSDPEHPNFRSDMTLEDRVRLVLQGHGKRGSSYDYLKEVWEHLVELGIEDPAIRLLWEEVYRQRHSS